MTSRASAVTTALDMARCVALRLDERLERERADRVRQNGDGSRTENDPLADWRNVLCPEEPHLFDRRLQWDGLEESRVAELIATPREPPLPIAPWAEFLTEVCNACQTPFDGVDRSQDVAAPLPFEEVLLPFVHVARRRLRRVIPDLDRRLLPAAQVSSERALLTELTAAAEQALFADFAVARATRSRAGLPFDGPPRSQYRHFVQALRDAHLEPLIRRYPVLARILAMRARFWVNASAEFVERLAADRNCLAKTFGIDPFTPVAHLTTGLGEGHRRGRSVIRVRFASDTEILYKPRSLSIDLAFYGLLEWLNARGLTPCQKTLRVLNRQTHGWVEPVVPEPMSTDGEIRMYFERAGGLLAVAYVLGATDLHRGNVIAAGSDLVLVDLESIMGASGPGSERDPTESPSRVPSRNNLLGTILLPYWLVTKDGWRLREGGLGGGTGDTIRDIVRTWRHPNTDWMVQRKEVRVAFASHRARKGPEVLTPVDHVEDIVHGFERGYDLLARHRDELLAERGPLAAFRGCRVRVMLRNTRVYQTALRRGLHPRHLKDGLEHSLQFEVLRSSLLRHSAPVGFWPAFRAEQRDLENLDYPLFSMTTDGLDLFDADAREVGTYGLAPPVSDTTERVAGLRDDDRRHQAAIIRFTLACLRGDRAPDRRDPDHKGLSEGRLLTTDACAIGRMIESLVVSRPDRPACWMGLQWTGRGRGTELRRLDYTFYDGSIGVALFLVALDAVAATGHGELAAEALLPLRRMLRDANALAGLVDRSGIGLANGMAGIVYVLSQIGRMTKDASWLDDARLAALALSESIVRSDESIEVLQGASGALLSLLSLHGLAADREILKRGDCVWRAHPRHVDRLFCRGPAHFGVGAGQQPTRVRSWYWRGQCGIGKAGPRDRG